MKQARGREDGRAERERRAPDGRGVRAAHAVGVGRGAGRARAEDGRAGRRVAEVRLPLEEEERRGVRQELRRREGVRGARPGLTAARNGF